VLIAMASATARAIVARMIGGECPELTELAQSGIAELGNVITGRATVLLSEAGYTSDLAPPMVMVGRGTTVNTLGVPRLVIPLATEFGQVEIQVALKVAATAKLAA
jgi:chemotaxis protein CheX